MQLEKERGEIDPMSLALPEGRSTRQLGAKVLLSSARRRGLGPGEDPRVQLALL